MEDFAEHDFCEVFRRFRGCGLQDACRMAEGLEELLALVAIVARQLLRQGRRLALHLVTGGEVPPGTPGV